MEAGLRYIRLFSFGCSVSLSVNSFVTTCVLEDLLSGLLGCKKAYDLS